VSHLEASLERLGVAAVDLYQLHFPNPAVPVPIQAEGLRRVLELGLTRHVGVSNFSLRRWSQTERALGRPVISNQVHYNLLQRKPERGLLEYAQRHSRVLLAYSPLAQGVLSGRYRAGALPDDRRRLRPLYSEAALAAATPLLEALSEIAAAHAAKPAQVALAYLLSHPRVVVIPGAKSVAQLEENVAAAEIELAQDEVQALRGASDRFHFSRARAVAEVLGRLSSGRRRTPA
ncbi:MAG: aldo/keto reductase, partial [Candidatus Dormibacteria bacterium]